MKCMESSATRSISGCPVAGTSTRMGCNQAIAQNRRRFSKCREPANAIAPPVGLPSKSANRTQTGEAQSGDGPYRQHCAKPLLLSRCFHRRERLFVLALAIGALRYRTGFQVFFDQITRAALRAFLRQRFAPGDEVAFRIAAATIECLAAFGAALHHFALRAVRTRHANR